MPRTTASAHSSGGHRKAPALHDLVRRQRPRRMVLKSRLARTPGSPPSHARRGAASSIRCDVESEANANLLAEYKGSHGRLIRLAMEPMFTSDPRVRLSHGVASCARCSGAKKFSSNRLRASSERRKRRRIIRPAAGIVDQAVDRREARQMVRSTIATRMASSVRSPATMRYPNLRPGDGTQLRLVPARQNQPRAASAQAARQPRADAVRRAGNDKNLAIERAQIRNRS